MSRPRRRGRDIHGVLLLDKPQGLSSNDALQKVKRLYNANRAGHTGALDPLATGMHVLGSVQILLMLTARSLKNVRSILAPSSSLLH